MPYKCAVLAEQAGETPAVIVAALLHDVGYLMMAESAIVWLRGLFGFTGKYQDPVTSV